MLNSDGRPMYLTPFRCRRRRVTSSECRSSLGCGLLRQRQSPSRPRRQIGQSLPTTSSRGLSRLPPHQTRSNQQKNPRRNPRNRTPKPPFSEMSQVLSLTHIFFCLLFFLKKNQRFSMKDAETLCNRIETVLINRRLR